ncbi:hypothetical protein BOO86_24025 [Mycobacterium sp. CBMA 234]|uniref:hypothetical protein n=1 Tax=Mycolicibacterium sp. CBMA 234 TaxID=1918495 RepID=UPI0012DF238E|nr:hypothetical protein [Mycolicibacterium sp. CBMA 234]MUL67561.1 hypothetical protein [Mycolicibacterium sp. CBMA 234]
MSRTYSRYSAPSGASTGDYGDTPNYGSTSYGYSHGSGAGYGSSDYSRDAGHDSYSGSYRDRSYGSYSSATDLADRPVADEYSRSYSDTDRFTAADADYDAAYDDEYADDDVYEYEDSIDRRWVWVAGVAGAILLVAVICTVVILGGGDSGPVTAPITPPSTSQSAPTTVAAAPSASPRVTAAPPTASLAPETVTTVTPTAAAPTPTADAVPPVGPAAAPVAPAANTVTYYVTGAKPLLDLVTVIYTDGQGALQTDVNVALPWTKTVTLNPGVTLSSVTATSVTSQLNCAISDGSGTAIAAQNNNTMIANCTK